jgi:hypothetical protein
LKNSHPPATSPRATKKKSSFWTSCPRKLGYYPDAACPLGKEASESRQADKGCAWSINSAVDNYCFWTWLRRRSDEDGFMEPVLQHEMADLLGSSGTKLHASYKEALAKMKELPEFADLLELFQAQDE